jgi:hypothetical protein
MKNISSLQSSELLSGTLSLAREERRITLALIEHLREIERRMLFAELGYSSLFDFAVGHLGLSEGSAARRIQAMRLIRDVPEVKAKIEQGSMSLSTAAQAQRFFRAEKMDRTPDEKRKVLAKLENRSQKECERALVRISPAAALPRERERVVSADRTELRLVVTDETLAKLKKLEALWSHKLERRKGEGWAGLLDAMADELLKKDKQVAPANAKLEQTPSIHFAGKRGRSHIPTEVRRLVHMRAGGGCEFRSDAVKRCESRRFLQVDHKIPVALGGSNDPENLRLLCRTHNQQAAVRALTPKRMRLYLPRLS